MPDIQTLGALLKHTQRLLPFRNMQTGSNHKHKNKTLVLMVRATSSVRGYRNLKKVDFMLHLNLTYSETRSTTLPPSAKMFWLVLLCLYPLMNCCFSIRPLDAPRPSLTSSHLTLPCPLTHLLLVPK